MTSNKEFILFPKDKISFKEKFYLLMDLLVSNQHTNDTESLLLFSIYFLQYISGFFCKQLKIINAKDSTIDAMLCFLENILLFKDLFSHSYDNFSIFIYVLCIFFLLFTIAFIVRIFKTDKFSFYTAWESSLNYCIKIFIYILYNMSLDMAFSNFCLNSSLSTNPNFSDIPCSISHNPTIGFLCVLILIYVIFSIIFIQLFYNDSLYLSNSPYAKISCNYEIYMALNSILYSLLKIHAVILTKEMFLIYNAITSILFAIFYFRRYLFYNRMTNILCGLFHVLYVWTAFFFLLFAYVDFNEKGIIFLVSCVIVLYFYLNLKYKIEETILLATPFYKISNKSYLLYYIKSIIDKMNNMNRSPEEKAILTGIIQMHAIECPNPLCLSKNKKRIYLPVSNEWSDRSKPVINDRVFLLNFVIIIMNFFIEQNYYSADMIINISLYYLEIIGNYSQSLFYYKKAKEMKLSWQESFSFTRLRIAISKTLVSKLKPPNEPCYNLEDLDMTLYFKYADLSQKLYEQMSNDVNFLLMFWKTFKDSQTDSSKSIDFNQIFHLTDKIRITKSKVDVIWNQLFEIYNGVNDLFDLYLNYTEQINDDDLLKRDLDEIKRKTENSAEYIQQNYYSILFNKETGIIIANGDKGKEGIIEKSNNSIEEIFKYKAEELKGLNVSQLMPRLLAQDHKSFIEKFNEYGEKKLIDNKEIKTFGKDKNNSILLIRLALKLFPMINENVFFSGMIVKESIDDIIFIDSKFIIQGMSSKLMKILQIDNNALFNENDIPFYVICKKFVNFYNIFLRKKKNTKSKGKIQASSIVEEYENSNTSGYPPLQQKKEGTPLNMSLMRKSRIINEREREEEPDDEDKEDEAHENIEINENIELEYEIKIPQFIYDFSSYQNKKEKRIEMNMTHKDSAESDTGIVNNNLSTVDDQYNEYIESDLLVEKEEINQPSSTKPIKEKDDKPKRNRELHNKRTTVYKEKKITDAFDANQTDFSFQADEEKEFIQKIQEEKDLFDNGLFNELEAFIDQCNKNSNIAEFKFNFTFDRYKYGEKQTAYIVRCIDNKIEGVKSDGYSIGEECDQKITQYRKEKNASLVNTYELVTEEKYAMLSQHLHFVQMSLENKPFQKLLIESKEQISKISIVHGHKKEDVIEDENSSQTSQASYNADLCKKNHIEEIRANIMKNVSNFFTLQYIKLLVIALFITTLILMALFMVFAYQANDNLSRVSNLNNELFQSTLYMSYLESALISLRTLFLFRKDQDKSQFGFRFFVEPESKYFDQMKGYVAKWYEKIIDNLGLIEAGIGYYISDSVKIFWSNEDISYSFQISDEESFPLALSQILSDVNSLLANKGFTYQKEIIETLNSHDLDLIDYAGFISIENAVSNLIPSQYLKIKSIPFELQTFNNKQMNIIIFIIILDFVLVCVYIVLYSLLLYLTNKNMGEGLEKVNKIHLEKIEDTIKRIESFYFLLKKHHDKTSRISMGNELMNNKSITINDKNNSHPNSHNNGGFNSENKKHKRLNILNYSYFQIIVLIVIEVAFLTPLYFITFDMKHCTNQIMNVNAFMFGKILMAAAGTVNVKCMMSQCLIQKPLDYLNIVNKSELQSVVQGLSLFPALLDFYNNKFLMNACDAAFNSTKGSLSYDECMNDIIIKSANNTDSLLKLIEELVDSINKDKELREGTKVELPNQTVIDFTSFLLYDTEEFKELESVFFKYIAPVSDNFADISKRSLNDYLKTKFIIICILGAVMTILVLMCSVYIGVCFVGKLIHLLSVSRCILKIIPTVVITNTQELENWIENKH